MREGLMDDSGYSGFDECSRYKDCCKSAYEQGREDAFDEFRKFLNGIDKGLLEIFNQFHSEKLNQSK